MTGRQGALFLAVLLGAPLAGCSDDGPGEGEARLHVNGAATVERADGDVDSVDGSTDLSRGDRVEVTAGVAVMQLRGGTTFELRTGLGRADDTAVLMAERPVLEAGDLLVTTSGLAQLEADGTEVDVIDGAARVSRSFGMSVSAYDADVELESAGATAEVPALRRMTVPDLGQLPGAPRPVSYDREDPDPWDTRYLGGAIELGRRLGRIADDLFTDVFPAGSGRTVGFFKQVLPDLEDEPEFDDVFQEAQEDGQDDPSETFLGAAITARGERGDFADRWSRVFTFREAGADWGIVALDQAVASGPLVEVVEQAFNTSFDQVARGVDSTPPDAGGTDGGTTDGGTSGTDGGSGGTDGGSTDGDSDGGSTDGSPPPTEPPNPPPTLPPPPEPPEPPDALEPVIDPVVDPVVDLVDDLLP